MMTDPINLLSISASIVATLFGILTVVIGWFGARLIVKQDTIIDKIDIVKEDLHTRIYELDLRLVRVETIVNQDE